MRRLTTVVEDLIAFAVKQFFERFAGGLDGRLVGGHNAMFFVHNNGGVAYGLEDIFPVLAAPAKIIFSPFLLGDILKYAVGLFESSPLVTSYLPIENN